MIEAVGAMEVMLGLVFVSNSHESTAALSKHLVRCLPSRAESILSLVWEAACQGQPLHRVKWSCTPATAVV